MPSLSADVLACRCSGFSSCHALEVISLFADCLSCCCSDVSNSLALPVLSLFMASLNSRLTAVSSALLFRILFAADVRRPIATRFGRPMSLVIDS